MSQYKTGTCSVTNGSNTVNISGASSGAESVTVGDSFKVDRDGEAIYQISSRTPASGASLTSITLSTNYTGVTGSGLGYQITTDFTPYRNYPELAQGDADAADWITKALRMIDQDLGTIYARKNQSETITGQWDFITNGTNKLRTLSNTDASGIYAGITGAASNGRGYYLNIAEPSAGSDYYYNGGHVSLAATTGARLYLRAGGYTGGGITIDTTGNVGLGISIPDTTLHVYRGDSGGSSSIEAGLTIEDDVDVYLQFLSQGTSTNNDNQGLLFGDAANNIIGMLYYDHTYDSMNFRTNGVTYVSINSSGQLVSTVPAGTSGIILTNPKSPASASATGVQGEVCWDMSYLYACVNTNTWKRVALSSW